MQQLENLVDVEKLLPMVVEFLPRLGVAIVISIGLLVLHRISRIPIRAAFERTGIQAKHAS